jgi:hypothetical protein
MLKNKLLQRMVCHHVDFRVFFFWVGFSGRRIFFICIAFGSKEWGYLNPYVKLAKCPRVAAVLTLLSCFSQIFP